MRIDGVSMRSTMVKDTQSPRTGNEQLAAKPQNMPEAEKQTSNSADKKPAMLTDSEKKLLPVSEKAVLEAIEKANKSVMGANTKFEFSIHEKTKEIMVKVIDSDTNEVIRQIPPEKILDMIAGIWDLAGLFVDERY